MTTMVYVRTRMQNMFNLRTKDLSGPRRSLCQRQHQDMTHTHTGWQGPAADAGVNRREPTIPIPCAGRISMSDHSFGGTPGKNSQLSRDTALQCEFAGHEPMDSDCLHPT